MYLSKGAALVLFWCFVVLLNLVSARFSRVGDLLLLTATLYIFVVSFKANWVNRESFAVFLGFVAIFAIYTVSTILNPSIAAAIITTQIMTCAAVFFVFYANAHRYSDRADAIVVVFVFLVMALMLGVSVDLAGKNVYSGTIVYLLLFLSLLLQQGSARPSRRIGTWTFIGVVILGLVFDQRAMQLAGLIALVAFWILLDLNHVLVRWLGLASVVALVLVMVFMTAGIAGFSINTIDDLVVEYSGRTAKSGRQVIWPILVYFIGEKPLFGWGAGTLPRDVIETTLSAHSYYLQILLQTGFVGLVALIGLFLAVAKRYRTVHSRKDKYLRAYMWSCVFLIVFHASSEVFLMQNNMVVAVPLWMLLGAGAGLFGRAPTELEADSGARTG